MTPAALSIASPPATPPKKPQIPHPAHSQGRGEPGVAPEQRGAAGRAEPVNHRWFHRPSPSRHSPASSSLGVRAGNPQEAQNSLRRVSPTQSPPSKPLEPLQRGVIRWDFPNPSPEVTCVSSHSLRLASGGEGSVNAKKNNPRGANKQQQLQRGTVFVWDIWR